jgi:hypothetical protein
MEKNIQITKKIVTEFLPHEMWYGFECIIPFVTPFIEKHNIKPNDHSWYQSGGGCCHYMIRDENNHIYTFHSVGEIVEKSHNTWEGDTWMDDYLDDEYYTMDDGYYTLGMEFESPGYQEKHSGGGWGFWDIDPKAYKKLEGVRWNIK